MIQYDLQGNCYELGIRGDKEMNDDIEELKAMIEPLKDWEYWEYSCTDEDVKKAMETKSYVEIFIEEQDKRIKKLQQELQRKDNIINELKEWARLEKYLQTTKVEERIYDEFLDKIKELENGNK